MSVNIRDFMLKFSMVEIASACRGVDDFGQIPEKRHRDRLAGVACGTAYIYKARSILTISEVIAEESCECSDSSIYKSINESTF